MLIAVKARELQIGHLHIRSLENQVSSRLNFQTSFRLSAIIGCRVYGVADLGDHHDADEVIDNQNDLTDFAYRS